MLGVTARRRVAVKRMLKPVVALLLSLPLLWLAEAVRTEFVAPGSALGADPGEMVVHHLGDWGLRFLLLTLAITPLRRRFGWHELARCRRMTGLFAFSYLSLHLLAYLGLLAGFDRTLIVEDLTKRPYIIAGGLGLLALSPLAVTSTRGWQRRLGRDWRKLHRLVFPATGLGLLHLLWLTKDGYGEFTVYLVILVLLVAERLFAWRGSIRPARGRASAVPRNPGR